MQIEPHETKIIDSWTIENGHAIADCAAKRIVALTQNLLAKVVDSVDGWSVLYFDKADGRYWELAYPESGLHGGGAPCLTCIPPNEVVNRYKVIDGIKLD